MNAADTRPLPLQRLLPWWPAPAVAAAPVAALALAAGRGHLDAAPALAALADWKMALACWAVLSLLLGVAADAVALYSWRRGIARFDPAAPDARSQWSYLAYSSSRESQMERHSAEDLAGAIARRRDKLARTVTQGWLFRYVLLCVFLPLSGLAAGLTNLRELGGSVPMAELFRPLAVTTLGSMAVMVLSVLVARHARFALDVWEEKARGLARAESVRRVPEAAVATAAVVPATQPPLAAPAAAVVPATERVGGRDEPEGISMDDYLDQEIG